MLVILLSLGNSNKHSVNILLGDLLVAQLTIHQTCELGWPRITGVPSRPFPSSFPGTRSEGTWRVVLGWFFHFNTTRCWFLTIWRLVIMQYCLIYVYIYVVFLILTFAKCSKFEDVWRLFHSRLYGYWILSRISPESSPCSSNQP